MADTKIPTHDEPTDLRLTPDEYDERYRRHQRFSKMIYALRREYLDRSYEEEHVRSLIRRHESETWRRGDVEWWNRSQNLLDRLHRIGVEQLEINERIATLSTLASSMAAAEDAQKMADQAMEAARRADEDYIGPRTEVWWKRKDPPSPPWVPLIRREDWENYYQCGGGYIGLDSEGSYEEYLERHYRNRADYLNTTILAAEQGALEQQVYDVDDIEELLRAIDEEDNAPTRRSHYL